MLHVERFINQLMTSNCYVVVDEESKHCLCIDPASEKSEREIAYIVTNRLSLDYIILTHEHTDHTWGVNALIDKYPSVKIICTELCKEALPKEAKAYFQFYYDDPNYEYNVRRIDYTTEELKWHLVWFDHAIQFIHTPGHSPGSICVSIEDLFFGGDTLMPFKPFIKKRSGGAMNVFKESISMLKETISLNTIVYPGHGDMDTMGNMLEKMEVQ